MAFFNLIKITAVTRILTILEPVGAFTLVTPLSSLKMKKENMQQKETYQDVYMDYLWVVELSMIFISFLIFSVFSKFSSITWMVIKVIFKR